MADAAKLEKEFKSGKNPLKDSLLVDGKAGGDSKYTLYIETPQQGVEPYYFWILNMLQKSGRYGLNFSRIEKIKDIFSASETSAYWGDVEARRAIQQDRFEKYMTTIGGMTKSLIQMLRDLRILEERLSFYQEDARNIDSATVALKTIWTDLVEGKSPTSVFALAGQPGYVTLPDLFFSTHPKTVDEVERIVGSREKQEGLQLNERVKSVLKQKLTKFLLWKEKTFKELEQRWRFQLKYLQQHVQVIKLYLNWLRPYLNNIKTLQTASSSRAELVKAFDTSMMDLEILAIGGPKPKEGSIDNFKEVIRIKFEFTAVPQIAYQEGSSRGAIHLGKTIITIEGTVANEKQIEDYKKDQDEEDLKILTTVDESLEAMKDELDYYLKKAEELNKKEKQPEPETKKEKSEPFFEPFTAIWNGFKDIFGKGEKKKTETILTTKEEKESLKNAVGASQGKSYALYYVFKKSHGMITE
ncbi:MAG: hypothetical protein Q8R00_04635 [Candidatus Nanoarchaeia archaeon]|nr:hypothetical protein [Candidatus Nanoarchaeia archaeon]